MNIRPEKSATFEVNLRIPNWCKSYNIKVNDKKVKNTSTENGYVTLNQKWNGGDKIELELDMPVEVVSADPRVKENVGKRAIQRGPLVYCMEQTDNKDIDLNKVVLNKKNKFNLGKGKNILKDLTLLETNIDGKNLIFIPYFARDNREAGKMKVWIDYKN